MNPAKVPDLTMTTIALVVNEVASPPTIAETDVRQLLRPPITVGQLPTGHAVFSSSRDQIDVVFGPTKIDVRDLSGSTDFLQSKVPATVHAVLAWYKTAIRTYGINFIITIDKDDPEVWIKDNLLNPTLANKTGKELLRGRAHVSFQATPKTWNIQFAANPDGKLELNFNASEETGQLPDARALKQQLADQFQSFKSLIDSLGL